MAEGILSNARQVRLVPRQYYADSLHEFIGQLKSFIESGHHGEKRFSVLVDGVPKQCSEKNVNLDTLFCEALSAAGFSPDLIVLTERFGLSPRDLHASHRYVDQTREMVCSSKSGLYLVLGSGSITDVVKHALFLEGIAAPFLSVPTALTVTAFTSAFSVIDWHGAKRTLPSREISATFWIKSILECAPSPMSRAGYGDLLARFIAYGDWYLGKCLGVMGSYDECAFRLMEPFSKGIKESAEAFSRYPLPEETIQCISAALAMAGIAMSVSGETTPLSGFEHVISHGLDFLRHIVGREVVLHGEQVALGCLTSAQAIDWLVEKKKIDSDGWLEDPEGIGLKALNELIDTVPVPAQKERIENARPEFVKEYRQKSKKWKDGLIRGKKESFIKNWPEIRDHLERLTLRTAEMVRLVGSAGLPSLPEETNPPTSQQEYHWAVRFSPFVRSRMNISDLIFWMGKDITKFIYSRLP